MTVFDPESVLPASVLAQITEARVRDPERVVKAAASRRRRTQLTRDGRLNLVAADHPARGVMNAQDEPMAMAHRGSFLARVVRALQAADGVMATMDVLEDLLLLDEPTAALDLGGREALVATLADLAADPSTPPMVQVTHHVEEIPPGFTHALLLEAGRVVNAGPLADVVTEQALSSCYGLDLRLTQAAGRWAVRVNGSGR